MNKVIDNNRVKLQDAFINLAKQHDSLSVATGYWDLLVMKEVWEYIKNYKSIRLLIGREPLLARDNKDNKTAPEPDYPDDDFFRDLQNIPASPEMSNIIVEIKQAIDDGRMHVKVFRRSFLHAKAYIFGDFTSSEAAAILGSSNFTHAGFNTNYELNTTELDHRIVTFKPQSEEQEHGYLSWFEELWNDEKTENWNGEFVDLISTSPTGDLLYSPYHLYIRAVYESYKNLFEAQETIYQPTSYYTLKDFQERNVKNLKYILDRYGVAMLADSVGLGKTVSAIGVIKQYGQNRVVVIAPAALVDQWKHELAKERLHHVTVLSLQDTVEIEKQKEFDKYAPVNLFVIDESHNLRNSNSKRYEQVIDWIASEDNEAAHTLLLTATPINNVLDDLVNQILLGARGNQDIFVLPTYESNTGAVINRSFYQVVENIKKQINQNKRRLLNKGEDEQTIRRELQEIYNEARCIIDPVIRAFVVRNTRQSIKAAGEDIHFPEVIIKNNKYDLPDLEKISIPNDFQQVIESDINELKDIMDIAVHPLKDIESGNIKKAGKDDLQRTTMLDLYKIILSLGFVPYRWRIYKKDIYGKSREEIASIISNPKERSATLLQFSIYGMMRVNYLKRLESSPYALKRSLERYTERLDLFTKYLVEKDAIISLSDIASILGDEQESEPDITAISEYVQKKQISVVEKVSKKYDVKRILEDIKKEKKVIDTLINIAEQLIKHDKKILSLKERILNSHKNDSNKKILIFTTYKDTLDYIKQYFINSSDIQEILNKAAFVSGANKKEALNAAGRFSPKARSYNLKKGENELFYLFSTDVLSEGQNLQDAQELVNYDLHWNPVRMIQRNGRINRIGSEHKQIFVHNYVPNDELESLLGLVQAIKEKIELMRITVGTDTQVLDEEIDPRSYTGIYSDDESVATQYYEDLEQEVEKLSDEEFVQDLMQFMEKSDDKTKRKVLRIPPQSWTKHKYNFVDADVLSVAKVGYVDNSETKKDSKKEKIFFFTLNSEEKTIDVIPQTYALAKLKVSSSEVFKPKNTITEDLKSFLSGAYSRRAKQIVNIDMNSLAKLTETQGKVHSMAKDFGFTVDDLDDLMALLQTRNVILARKVGRLVRLINTAIKNNETGILQDKFDRLKELSKIHARQIQNVDVESVTELFNFLDTKYE